MRALDLLVEGSVPQKHPIEEQLRQCPEAFQAGELLERALNSLTHSPGEMVDTERWLPPAGAVVPPLV